jgi:hypothetical protein
MFFSSVWAILLILTSLIMIYIGNLVHIKAEPAFYFPVHFANPNESSIYKKFAASNHLERFHLRIYRLSSV